MFKNFIALIIASLVIIFSLRFLQIILHWLLQINDRLSQSLHTLLTGPVGETVADILAMLILPIIIGAIVGTALWLIQKRSQQACFFAIITTWVAWLILVIAMVVH